MFIILLEQYLLKLKTNRIFMIINNQFVDLASITSVVPVGKLGGGHISSVQMLTDSLVLAGAAGIQRISSTGERQPVSYREGE